MTTNLGDIGLIGLAVMGENLARNISSKGFKVIVYDRFELDVNRVIDKYGSSNLQGVYDIKTLVNSLSKPRKIMMMIKAGSPVDDVIEALLPYLDQGDIIIDGGNSNYIDTINRTKYLKNKGFLFIGTGVSGGEEGALNGPSVMPGGSISAWPKVKDILQSISAKVDNEPCCDWIGSDGAGHYVKMIHNGIEYGDMQIIAETYFLMKKSLGMNFEEIKTTFSNWNKGKLESYLIEITADIIGFLDEDGNPLLEKILDKAGQKGTGKWTGIASLEENIPLTLITEAVYARFLSAIKAERVKASKFYNRDIKKFDGNKVEFLNDLHDALYASKIISYAQGYSLLRAAANNYNWNLDYGKIAEIWRGGCIIRSKFLNEIKDAYTRNKALENLLLDDYFKKTIQEILPGWQRVCAHASLSGIAIPALSSALSYFHGYTSDTSPANLIQAQRDYFGAHTYERIDCQEGEFYHTNWTGRGGKTSSSTYNV